MVARDESNAPQPTRGGGNLDSRTIGTLRQSMGSLAPVDAACTGNPPTQPIANREIGPRIPGSRDVVSVGSGR